MAKTVIICAPRTGSTSLFTQLCKERKVPGYFNPWDRITNDPSNINWNLQNFVLKCGIIYSPIKNGPQWHQSEYMKRKLDWFVDLANKFDEVILLSRKDRFAHVESYMHLLKHNTEESFNEYKKRKGKVFTSTSQYIYDPDEFDEDMIKRAHAEINNMNIELRALSARLDVPLQYYEDWFDVNSKDRYRREKEVKLI